MNTNLVLKLIPLLLLLFMSSCGCQDSETTSMDIEMETLAGNVRKGSFWVYQDSSTAKIDTIKVVSVVKKLIPYKETTKNAFCRTIENYNEEKMISTTSSNNIQDYILDMFKDDCKISGTTITYPKSKLYLRKQFNPVKLSYISPLNDSVSYINDNYFMILPNLQVGIKKFGNVKKGTFYLTNKGYKYDFYISLGVGLVRAEKRRMNEILIRQINLIESRY